MQATRTLRGYTGVAPARTTSLHWCRRIIRLRTPSRPRVVPAGGQQPARDELQRSEAPIQIGIAATVVQAAALMSPPPASAQLLPFTLTGTPNSGLLVLYLSPTFIFMHEGQLGQGLGLG
jgi:hypothetical protein